jgi:cation diffusion facilitator family transporter
VLTGVIVIKGLLWWRLGRLGRAAGSPAVQGDSLHHASDALTSAAAFVGISVALLAGPGWESADDWAALAACGIIAGNAVILARGALRELMDEAADPALEGELRAIAAATPGVLDVEKSRVRRSGAGLLMDIHIEVDAESTVREGHDVARAVKLALLGAGLRVTDVVVHVEPWDGADNLKDHQ